MRLLPPVTTAQSAVPVLTLPTDAQLSKKKQLTRYPTLTGAPLTKAKSDALANELNALYRSVMDSLGSEDARYIKRVYATVVYSEMTARSLLAAAGCSQNVSLSRLGYWVLHCLASVKS